MKIIDSTIVTDQRPEEQPERCIFDDARTGRCPRLATWRIPAPTPDQTPICMCDFHAGFLAGLVYK